MPISGHFKGRSTVRWGIIGCGDVTELKSGPGFKKASGSELVGGGLREETRSSALV
jgi:hypothetical protein